MTSRKQELEECRQCGDWLAHDWWGSGYVCLRCEAESEEREAELERQEAMYAEPKLPPINGTHGSHELDEDAAKLLALGEDPGPTLDDIDDSLAAGSYRDDVYPERLCDRCASLYRGPAVYCSLECAIADA